MLWWENNWTGMGQKRTEVDKKNNQVREGNVMDGAASSSLITYKNRHTHNKKNDNHNEEKRSSKERENIKIISRVRTKQCTVRHLIKIEIANGRRKRKNKNRAAVSRETDEIHVV